MITFENLGGIQFFIHTFDDEYLYFLDVQKVSLFDETHHRVLYEFQGVCSASYQICIAETSIHIQRDKLDDSSLRASSKCAMRDLLVIELLGLAGVI